MITNKILTNKESRNAILNGVKKVADAVTSTLGPGGRNVIIEQLGGQSPVVTKDGVSVARSINLEDNFENMGARMVIEVASKTNSACGDGTTTATLLAYEMYKNAVKAVDDGHEPMEVKREMLSSLEKAKNLVKEVAIPVASDDDIRNVACISANGDTEIGDMVSQIVKETGKEGIVVVQEGKNLETTWSTTKGVRLDSGFVSPYFANDPSGQSKAVFEDAWILFCAKKVANVNELYNVMSMSAKSNHPLVIIAPDFDADVMATMVVNRLRGLIKTALVKAPGVQEATKLELITDAAIATGGTVINDDLGLKLTDTKEEHLGKAKRVEIDLHTTTFIDGCADKDKFDKRVNELRSQIASEGISDYYLHIAKERLAKLVAGIGVVKVGGETASIIHEKRDRIDDAICATRAARAGGVVAGAGTTLLKAGYRMVKNGNGIGDEIVGNAMKAPFLKILDNAGYANSEDASEYTETVDNGTCGKNDGYDVRKWEYHEDLVKSGVIDPTNVTLSALTNAVSVAALLISTDCMVGINADSIPQIPMGGEQML